MTALEIAPSAGSQRVAAEHFGHPKGLFYLAFAEGWERFSFYGMQALLVLYMGEHLLLPGHAEHVAGRPTVLAVQREPTACDSIL